MDTTVVVKKQAPSVADLSYTVGGSNSLIISEITDSYIAYYGEALPDVYTASEELLLLINQVIAFETATSDGKGKYSLCKVIPEHSLACILSAVGNIALVQLDEETKECVLSVYHESGELEGVWEAILNPVKEKNVLREIIEKVNTKSDEKYVKEVVRKLENLVAIRKPTRSSILVPCKNGIYNIKMKRMEQYSDRRDLTFTYKIPVNYNPNAVNVVIHNPDDGTDWDVESWVKSIGVTDETTQTLWEVINACVRPFVSWDKTALLYGESGNNGKGTFCAMLRNLCGSYNTTSISIDEFDSQFGLSELPKSSLVINDENEDDLYIDKVKKFKACVTNDPVACNRKYMQPITIRWQGFQVQCLNTMFQCNSKSKSFIRRLLFVPLNACFTGCARKYIKNDYIKRQDVLEYVLKKAIDIGAITEFSDNESSEQALRDFRLGNDEVFCMMDELEEEFKWDFLPYGFLYDLFLSYKYRGGLSGKKLSKSKFTRRVKEWVKESNVWTTHDEDKFTIGSTMDKGEPLIYEYKLETYYNPDYHGSDIEKKCIPYKPKKQDRGLVRSSYYNK